MKKTSLKYLCLAALSAAFLSSVSPSNAAPLDDTLSYTNNFDGTGNTGTASWLYWYGVNPGNSAMAWDSTMDADTNASSGSLLYEATIPANNQQAWFGTFNNGGGYDFSGTHDPTKYTNIAVYVHVDPSTALDANGDFGALQMGFYEFLPIGLQTIPASATNGWVRLVQPIDPAAAGTYGQVGGIGFRYQTYYQAGNVVGHMKMWLDKLTFNVSPVLPKPPTLSAPTKATPGLNLFSSPANGDQFQRTSIYMVNHTGAGWVGQANVTYSFTITNFPGAVYSGYQTHLFIMPGVPLGGGETAPDYNEPHLLWLNVQGNADGTASAYLRYKIYETNSNANLFGAEVTGPLGTPWAGQITNLNAASPLGTWSLTFNQDTNVVITGPGGVTTSATLHPEVAAIFVDPLNIVLGAQPNNTNNVGQAVILASASITNGGTATSVLNDNFLADSGLNPALWTPLTGNPSLVQVFPQDPGQRLVPWTLPDGGYSMQISTNLGNSTAWKDVSGLANYVLSGKRVALVPSAYLGSKQNFIRLIKRTFTQLQVLLPGQTNAPGTVLGYVGTPTPISLATQGGTGTTVTVNACDSQWHIISGITDTIHVTSTDGSALIPTDMSMVNGVATFADPNGLLFRTTGPQTVTGTDTADGTKTPGTSASVTINP